MDDTNESWKARALWQTLRLSFASYDELIFRLQNLDHNWIYFGFSPFFSFYAVVHAYWLEFKPGSGATVASVLHMFKHAFKACFLDWHFLTTNISPLWQLIIRPTFCPKEIYKRANKLSCLLAGLPAIRA